MSGSITKAALDGARITITPDCWPFRKKIEKIRVSMTKQTWNGIVTLNRDIPAADMDSEWLDDAVANTIGEMAEEIELPQNRKR